MNFFESQRQAKSKSNKLYYMFLGLVILISSLTAFTLSLVINYTFVNQSEKIAKEISISTILGSENFYFSLAIIFVITSVAIVLVSMFKIMMLRKDPASICRELGARPVPSDTDNFELKQYRNIVEEMSFASGVPVPQIYYLDDKAINAFACGFDIQNAAICVTKGSLNKLNRDELQAVVAHEYSHILNGDMNLNLKLIGLIAGLIFIYKLGEIMMRSRGRRRSNDKGGSIGLVLMLLGGLGWIGGLILQAAISRQREYLADASSVQFTRNPTGITGALKKIYANSSQGYIENPKAIDVNHMCLVEGYSRFIGLSSHPDLFDRIKAVDKNFKVKHFKEFEVKDIHEEWLKPKEKTKKVENKREDIKGRIQHLIPLFGFLKTLPSEKQTIEHSVLSIIDNKIEEVRNLDGLTKLKFLEMMSGEIKTLDPVIKSGLKAKVVERIKADGKIDFNEFLIYAYLKPSFGEEIPLTMTSSSKVKEAASILLSYASVLGKAKDECIEQSKSIMPFTLITRDKINYVKLLKAVDDLRFCKIDDKEKTIKALKVLFKSDGQVSKREELVLHLIVQALAVPSISLDDL